MKNFTGDFMKLIIFAMIFLFTSVSVFAQKDSVPKNVKKSFSELFTKVENLKWSKQGSDFEANFTKEGEKISAVLDSSGNLIEMQSPMEIDLLPPTVPIHVEDKFKGYRIIKAYKIAKPKRDIFYKVVVSNGDVRRDLIFNYKGKYMDKDALERYEKVMQEKERDEAEKAMEKENEEFENEK